MEAPIIVRNNEDVGEKYPLHGITERDAREFWEKYKLNIELGVFIRGFLAFRHRAEIEARFEKFLKVRKDEDLPKGLRIGEHKFTDLELRALWDFWMRNKWATLTNMSRLHRLLIVACIFAAMTQGWDQAVMAGASLEVMNAFHKPITSTTENHEHTSGSYTGNPTLGTNTWLLGLLVGAPFLCGAPIGLLITDRLTEVWQFGRRGALCVASLCSFISVIGSGSVHNIWDFLAFRVLLGVGMAGKASIVPIILSETSPQNVRGILLVFWQLFVTCGLAAGSVANLSLYHLNEKQSWRYMFISAFIPALLLFSIILFSPESPRWLLKKSGVRNIHTDKDRKMSKVRVRDALRSLVELHHEPTHVLASGELVLLYKRLVEEQSYFHKYLRGPESTIPVPIRPLSTDIVHMTWKMRWQMMISEGHMRRANYAAASVMIGQQLCGINVIIFLTDHFLRNSFFEAKAATTIDDNTMLLGASFGINAWNFLSTIPALFYIDTSDGRRTLLNWSFPCMAISLLASALVLLAPDVDLVKGRASAGVMAGHLLFLALFVTAYSVGEGPAAFVISAEVFPLINRELGMSLAVFWNFLGAGLLALLAPALLRYLKPVGILSLFAGTNLPAWAACYWLVPNTGNEELEEVFKRLNAPTKFTLVYTIYVLQDKLKRIYARWFQSRRKEEEHPREKMSPGVVEQEFENFQRLQPGETRIRPIWRHLTRNSQEMLRLHGDLSEGANVA